MWIASPSARNDSSTRTRNAELQRHCEERSDEAIHDNGV